MSRGDVPQQTSVIILGGNVITVVSGIPRSGTSMMMQMLKAGGIDVYADTEVAFETSNMLELPQNYQWLQWCEGRAVKILDPLLYTPPLGLNYKFVWMDRDYRQQAKSQRKFLAAVGTRLGRGYNAIIERKIAENTPKSVQLLERRGPVLRVKFEAVLASPSDEARRVVAFLGRGNAEAMARAVIQRGPECLPHMLELELLAQGEA